MKQIERFIILIYVSQCRKQENKQIRRPSVKYAAREKLPIYMSIQNKKSSGKSIFLLLLQ